MAGTWLVRKPSTPPLPRPESQDSTALFQRRIAPLFRSPNPSNCADCHLEGVDLKDYIAETVEKIFRLLQARGMIDLKNPDQSEILRFIRMAPQKSPLISQKVRQEEYAAFRDWIRAGAANPQLRRLISKAPPAGKVMGSPKVPVEVIRHGRKDRLLDSFVANVWAQEQRCAHCHASGTEENKKLVPQHGERITWIVPDDPEATLDRMAKNGLMNTATPEKSLLLLKPTMAVQHGGGKKMVAGDAGYKAFRSFLEDYSKIKQGSYRSAKELPPPPQVRYVSSEYWLKLENTPPAWADKLLGVSLYFSSGTTKRRGGGINPSQSRIVRSSERGGFGSITWIW